MDFLGVVGPGTLPPVPKTTGFQQQHMQQRILVGLGAGCCGVCGDRWIKQRMELSTELIHRAQHIGVALDPAQVVGPGRTLHAEAGIVSTQSADGLLNAFCRGVEANLIPKAMLLHRLDRGELICIHSDAL